MVESNLLPSSSTPSSGTSPSLLARVRAEDASAWDRLVKLYAPLIFHWCRRARLQDHDVEDVFQEVFGAVLTHIRNFKKNRQSDTFRGWLFAITRNKIRDHFRRARREPRAEGGTEALARLAQIAAPERKAPAHDPDEADVALEQNEMPADDDVLSDADTTSDAQEERALYHRALELIRSEFRERTWKACWRTAVDDQSAPDVAAELRTTIAELLER